MLDLVSFGPLECHVTNMLFIACRSSVGALKVLHPEYLQIIFSVKIITVQVVFNLLKPTGYVMHQQFNIQQLHTLPTLYLCVVYLSENKQRLVPLTA